MTTTEQKTFRTTLEASQTELGTGIRNREVLYVETSPDDLDRIQHTSECDFAMNALERRSNRLREVRTALLRMDAATFGICAGCQADISPKRLAAIPWASYCIACQEAADHQQKPSGSELEFSFAVAA